MLEGKALIEDTDMPVKMQIQAMASASEALDLFDVIDCKSIAAHIKKEFDTKFGCGWQCVGLLLLSENDLILSLFVKRLINLLQIDNCLIIHPTELSEACPESELPGFEGQGQPWPFGFPQWHFLFTLLPLPASHIAVTLTEPPQEGQNQTYGQIGDLISQDIRSICDPNALLLTRVQVNRIHSNTETRDDLELGQGVDELGVGAGAGVSDDGADGVGVVLEELVPLRVIPEAEEVEALIELLLEVGVHWAEHEHADGFHVGRIWKAMKVQDCG
ncbi:dynein light chain 1, cytoplasmic-like [Senna tora]|uniref:Dynein light chain 1, cytoplasmic-like n=1 Tax=Senna tora TaxID=362788 RepID=A0A834XDM1_9FABA|nr:dynein light chain 1, cytoplasmic-like [Senna tora]